MDAPRVTELLADPELRWIWERIHARLLQGKPCSGVLRRTTPTAAERTAIEKLLGTVGRGGGLSVSLDELERRLQDGGLAASLAEAAKQVLGQDALAQRTAKEEETTAWMAACESIRNNASACTQAVQRELQDMVETGLLRRLSEGAPKEAIRLADGLVRLAERLPSQGTLLGSLAAEVAGDAHALDEGTPLGTLAVRLAARLGGVVVWDTAEGRREAWSRWGVLCDEVSAPALALNLWSEDDNPLGEIIRLHQKMGEPLRLSIRQLRRSKPTFALPKGEPVRICENPAILAAAANALGAQCPPLLCTEGMPKTAIRLLLEQLRLSGAELLFHADLDWAGIRIGNLLSAVHGARPWAMDVEAYLCAEASGPPLEGAPVEASWDPKLALAMVRRGTAVHEESVLPLLLEQLLHPPYARPRSVPFQNDDVPKT